MTDTYLVTGATGNVGREVLRALNASGVAVRAAVRNTQVPWPANVTPVVLDFQDPATFEPALRGVNSMFLMRPPLVVQVKDTLNTFIDVAAQVGVKHCVFLSVAGAERMNFIPHRKVELKLMASPLQWTFLRAGFFSQNLLEPYREDIREGTIVLPAAHAKVSFVDAYDLGEVAAMSMLNPSKHAGKAYHLTGQQALTFDEIAQMLSQALHRPIKYKPTGVLRYWLHARSRGVEGVRAAVYAILHVGLRNGSGAKIDPTLRELLGHPGRTMQEFIAANLDAWKV